MRRLILKFGSIIQVGIEVKTAMDAISKVDPALYELLQAQLSQETTTLKLIASENFASAAVLEALGSVFSNKYAEGYPGARYYEGNKFVDRVEELAIARLKSLFGAEHANVQPYSGSPANQAVCRAVLKHGDKVMGMPVPMGGHLTHGWGVNFSGTDYEQVPYGIDPTTHRIDYDQVREVALQSQPRLIWVGATAYPRLFDYEAMAKIASEVNAYLVADIAHISGLIVAGVHPNPVPYCAVVTSTSHKSLRGPRGGFILSRVEDRYHSLYHVGTKFNLAKRIDRAVFPNLQGGPHMNQIAALAVALKEASMDRFKLYGRQIVRNAQALASALIERGYNLVSGGTDNHLMIIDLRDKSLSGKDYAKLLADAGIVTNFNMVPEDPRSPATTSGIRIGTPAVTSMQMKEAEMDLIARFIDAVISRPHDEKGRLEIRHQVAELCKSFPVPGVSDIVEHRHSIRLGIQ
jgi:glycine hydroxymethyltransferase